MNDVTFPRVDLKSIKIYNIKKIIKYEIFINKKLPPDEI